MSYDWPLIKSRWEAGETAGQIAKDEGMPTRQGINKRAKKEGWVRKLEPFPVPAGGNTIAIPVNLEPRRRRALEVVSQGGIYKDAAAAAHVSESTFREWRKDPKYAALILAAETGIKLEMLGHIRAGAARDPKHAQWWLSRHPGTRNEFGHEAGRQVTGNTFNVLGHIDLGIDRTLPEERECELRQVEEASDTKSETSLESKESEAASTKPGSQLVEVDETNMRKNTLYAIEYSHRRDRGIK